MLDLSMFAGLDSDEIMAKVEAMNNEELTTSLHQALLLLTTKPVSSSSRKNACYKILEEFGPICIQDIADKMEINPKNVSSLLTYLRKDNILIHTNEKGEKFLA